MNRSLLAMLNDAEQELVRATEPGALAALDEDELLDLHARVRRARTKYSKLYRRRGADRVTADASRGRASATNAKTAAKAEIFEDTLARVSRRLATVAGATAKELRDERLEAARAVKGVPVKKAGPAAKGKATGSQTSRARGDAAKRSPAKEKARASTKAKGQRRQVKKDSRSR